MVTLLLLLALTTPTATTPMTPTSPTPLQEVEAWDPVGDARDPAAHPRAVLPKRDNGTQAVAAIGPVVGATLVGTAAGIVILFVAASVATTFLPAMVIGIVVASAVFVGLPAASVALFLDDLPGFTPWLTAGLVPLGAAIGFVAAGAAGIAYVNANPSDCALCALGGVAVFVIPPVVGLAGALAGGVAATTIGAFAEQ